VAFLERSAQTELTQAELSTNTSSICGGATVMQEPCLAGHNQCTTQGNCAVQQWSRMQGTVQQESGHLLAVPPALQLAIPGQDSPGYHAAYPEVLSPTKWSTKGWSTSDDPIKAGRGTSSGTQGDV
jgi:hypothetical protein